MTAKKAKYSSSLVDDDDPDLEDLTPPPGDEKLWAEASAIFEAKLDEDLHEWKKWATKGLFAGLPLGRRVALLRVGVTSSCGGIHSPLFENGSFELISPPDTKRVGKHKYGNCVGKNGISHANYFPLHKRKKMSTQHVHLDPEFDTFTYGIPNCGPGNPFSLLMKGDFLVFYAGLKRWDAKTGWCVGECPALYIIGYFEIGNAGMATDFSRKVLQTDFGNNFHVRYKSVFKANKDSLVLVKGRQGSRLLKKAYRISADGEDSAGRPMKVLSPAMQEVFGSFDGHISLQRSTPRWVTPECVDKTIKFLKRLK